MTRMQEARELWTDGRRLGWCKGGRAFAARHKTLGSAWRACRDGRFMAFWLASELPIPPERGEESKQWGELTRMRESVGMSATLFGGTRAQRSKFASLIRARFNCDGSLRKRSKAA